MKQLKEKESEKEGDAWQTMTLEERYMFEEDMSQIGRMARAHNMMGNMTILSLEMITREIKTIFCHEMMVDRIASMLNYFLLHLVRCLQAKFVHFLVDRCGQDNTCTIFGHQWQIWCQVILLP